MTFDYRPVNSATMPVAWPMPHINSECTDFSGSKFFASIDFCSGYWQLPLHENSQDDFSFITHEGIFSPTRTAQGAKNSSSNFQSRVEPCFAKLRDNFKAWQDDFVLHESSEEALLDVLQLFLTFAVTVISRFLLSSLNFLPHPLSSVAESLTNTAFN